MSLKSEAPPRHDSLATGAINLPELVLTALATLAPLGLVAGVMPLHFFVGGPGVPSGFIAAAAVMALFAVGLNAVLKYLRSPGAFYAIITRGLGRPVGGISAMLAVLAYNALQISTYGLLGVYAADSVARWTGLDLPWWVYGLASLIIVGLLGARGITASSKVLGTIMVFEIIALIVLVIAVLMAPSTGDVPGEVYSPTMLFRPESLAMFALVFGAFMGFESTAIYSEEAKGGSKTVRRATYIVVGFIGIFYSLMALIIVTAYGIDGIAGAAADDTAGLVTSLYAKFTSPVVFEIVNVLLILSSFAALLALHNAANRYAYTLGREGFLPRLFGRTDSKTHAPKVAGLLQSAVAIVVVLFCVIAGVDPYNGLLLVGSAIATLVIIMMWAICSLASLIYLRRTHPEEGLWRTLIAPGLAFIALSTVVVVVILNFDLLSAGIPIVNLIVAILVVGSAVAGLWRALHLRRTAPTTYAALASSAEERSDSEVIRLN